jgi:hypothetical protein
VPGWLPCCRPGVHGRGTNTAAAITTRPAPLLQPTLLLLLLLDLPLLAIAKGLLLLLLLLQCCNIVIAW